MGGGGGIGGTQVGLLTFVDATTDDFDAGLFTATVVADDTVFLATGLLSGKFVSRVFDAGVEGASWPSLAMQVPNAYRLPLPPNQSVENFPRSVSMADNVLLLSFTTDRA